MSTDSLALVADIGGTNARFALARGGDLCADSVQVLATEEYASLEAALSRYLRDAGNVCVQQACLAVAGPVQGQDIRLTNHPWQFQTGVLAQRFAWPDIRVINDFTAMALGVQRVPESHLVRVCGEPAARGPAAPGGPRARNRFRRIGAGSLCGRVESLVDRRRAC